ncbi:uncharacterized protein [Dysidea avara]|uniref:uncharacterized protein isoform X2 n=1 Tax=Dysidea avara TaxID=196820 RepID=UPI0033176529
MINKMINDSKKECFVKFYSMLTESLPMSGLTSRLYSQRLLPGSNKDKIDSLSTDKEKAQHFLDKVIKPGLEVGNTDPFDEMLRIMETSEDSTMKHVAGDMKKFMDGQSPGEAQAIPKVSPPLDDDLNKLKTVAKFSKDSNVRSAFTRMTSEIESILEFKKFSKLRRACVQEINSLGSNLPRSLVPKIQQTHSLDDMLDVLAQSPYWNWFDTRLLQALVSASGSAEAEERLESFKATFYAEKIAKLIPYVSIKPFKESMNLVEKFDKDPKDLTISELLQHKYKLEYEVLDIDEGDLVLSCIKTGCVELTWQVPQELVYRAYTSMKKKHDELPSLAVKSLVCKEGDEYAALPVLWHGQEVGEVGPIEPLPEHVRQKPYSLPQGFQWVTLSSSDVEKVIHFMNKHGSTIQHARLQFTITHPHRRSEWQFGIRTTNGKLVGVVLAYPVCMSIGRISVMCVHPVMACHKKYYGKRMIYMLHKELQRRSNLFNVYQFICQSKTSILKPLTTVADWSHYFTHPTSAQLPNSPRTPGWRKMTSEDVPSALALVNKYSSQFEIRQVFTSEEEFSHYFLCPAVPNFVFAFVVENKTNNITDFVQYKLIRNVDGTTAAIIATVVSTHSPVKQLITDVMVCARNNSVDVVHLLQFNMQDDILFSLGFKQIQNEVMYFYNYKYPEIHPTSYFFTF